MNALGFPHGWGYYIESLGMFHIGWWKNGQFHGNGYSIENK